MRKRKRQLRKLKNSPIYLILVLTFLFISCVVDRNTRQNSTYSQSRYRNSANEQYIVGTSSYYGKKYHGRKTANGETFNMYDLTAAHKTLPFGTILEVENLSNNKKVTVRINDRGPFVRNRILDLSFAAAEKIDMITSGIANIRARIIK